MRTAEPPLPRPLPIQLPLDQVREFCRRNHIRSLALFGSILRDDFRPESDIDVLVQFEPGKAPGLAFFTMQDELTKMIGRRVDLKTEGDLSKYFVDEVLHEAVPICQLDRILATRQEHKGGSKVGTSDEKAGKGLKSLKRKGTRTPGERARQARLRRLARECAKADPLEEQALAEEGVGLDLAAWPPY